MISKGKQFDCNRRKILEKAIGDAVGFFFLLEVEGDDLYIQYHDPQWHLVSAVSSVGRDTNPRVGYYTVGQKEELSPDDFQKIREWAVRIQTKTSEEVGRITEREEVETKARIEGARANREKKACSSCEDINSRTRPAFSLFGDDVSSKSNPGPHGDFSAFTCDCGIEYRFDRRFRHWEPKTQAEC